MICENIFCVYNKEENCVLDDVELDIQGKCTSCEYINIDDEYLEGKKKELLGWYDEWDDE